MRGTLPTSVLYSFMALTGTISLMEEHTYKDDVIVKY
jgi:hypothetical protein